MVAETQTTAGILLFFLIAAILWLPAQYILFNKSFMGIFGRRKDLRGKHVFITGGSKGIGFAIAQAFLRKGCRVSIVARSIKDLDEAKKILMEDSPGRVSRYSADTTRSDQLSKAVAAAEQDMGPIDILVCNAGISIPKLCTQTTIEEYEKQVDVNYMGTVRTTKLVLPRMLERQSGHILFVSSVMGVLGFAGYSSYAPTKWAIRGFADCLHNELQGTGVSVSIAYPPDTDTPGFAIENEVKADLCKTVNAALGSHTFTSDMVGNTIVDKFQKGQYHLTPPDLGASMLISTMTGLTPKVFWFPITMLLAPILALVSSVFGMIGNRAARKCNMEYGYPLPSSSSSSSS